MNNDKLLIIVVVLTIYLLCFRRSEGQETEMICKYTEGQLDDIVNRLIDTRVAGMFGSSVDSSGKFTKPVTIASGLELKDPNDKPLYKSEWNDIPASRVPTLRLMSKDGGFTMDASVKEIIKCRTGSDNLNYNQGKSECFIVS